MFLAQHLLSAPSSPRSKCRSTTFVALGALLACAGSAIVVTCTTNGGYAGTGPGAEHEGGEWEQRAKWSNGQTAKGEGGNAACARRAITLHGPASRVMPVNPARVNCSPCKQGPRLPVPPDAAQSIRCSQASDRDGTAIVARWSTVPRHDFRRRAVERSATAPVVVNPVHQVLGRYRRPRERNDRADQEMNASHVQTPYEQQPLLSSSTSSTNSAGQDKQCHCGRR